MKRTIRLMAALLAICVMTTLAACAGDNAKIKSGKDLEGKTIAFMTTPIPTETLKASLEEGLDVTLKEVTYYDTLQAAIAALKSGKAEAVVAIEPVADYYAAHDDKLEVLTMKDSGVDGSLHMALRTSDTQLIADVNAAIATMKEDGTLDALKQEFVTDLTPEKQLKGGELPYFDDAPTLRIGISGDNPPIDYIAADGNPAGYNIELLTKLSEIIHVNFEIEVMPMETKFPALASNKIDIFIIHVIGNSMKPTTQTMEENPDITISDGYYFFDKETLLVLK